MEYAACGCMEGEVHIYLYDIEDIVDKEEVLRRLCIKYATQRNLDSPAVIDLEEARIKSTPHGKPYFEGAEDVHFSISHSGRVWACAIDSEPIGFDIEDLKKNRPYVSLAKRFYTDEERNYALKRGHEAFLKIWVRKEAYLKYKGIGLSGGLASICFVHEDKLICNLPDCWVEEIFIDSEIAIAYCARRKRQIEVVKNFCGIG